ncbi:MAG: RNA polymerase sigma-70 factor, ECF subfamily [Parcubacteria group bacterium Gr01-1014_20]|nr:MAG: RNA polymerase sigma-70 factor, ECF subfamily [Parcubacteria group bacterium Gr01-1014_20]
MTPDQETEQKAILTAAHNNFEKGLNSHAFLKVNNHETGEDMVQDTFAKTWSYLVKGGKIDVMKAFLYHILNNLIVDEYRKRKTASLDVMMEKGFEPANADSGRVLNLLDGKSALVLIQRLPEKYQRVMRMRYVQDLSLKEMSLITGETKNAMAVQAHRGLEKLKLLYNPA